MTTACTARTVTLVLERASHGDHAAIDELMPLVYEELRRLAGESLRIESPAHTLQATALVHEAYLRLVAGEARSWENRAHFFAVAAAAIREILIDHARRKRRIKRGGGRQREPLESAVNLPAPEFMRLLHLDDALTSLATVDPEKARVVELRFFAGLTVEEVARVMDVSARTVARDWRLARAWLYSELDRMRDDEA